MTPWYTSEPAPDVMAPQVTDFHLDQWYGRGGPLGEVEYDGYYDYHTCWNTSNTNM